MVVDLLLIVEFAKTFESFRKLSEFDQVNFFTVRFANEMFQFLFSEMPDFAHWWRSPCCYTIVLLIF